MPATSPVPRLVCFIGPDGAGKSTLIRVFADALRRRGICPRCVWAGYKLWLLWPVIKLADYILRRRSRHKGEYGDFHRAVVQASSRRWLARTYTTAVFLEYIIELLIKVRFPHWLGKTVICDRYVYDTAVAISVTLNLSPEQHLELTMRWLRWFPQPDEVFYVSVPPELSRMRKADVPASEYVALRLPYYENAAREFGFHRLSGARPLKELSAEMEALADAMVRQPPAAVAWQVR